MMEKINDLLNQRLKKSTSTSKMSAMAQQSANGNLTSFSGVFQLTELSEREKDTISSILEQYAIDEDEVDDDLQTLFAITSEVKAINNQAALLHGERIKKAQTILTRYRDGAFTAWLMAAYGNRQTPYNLLQYYEFYEAMPKPLRYQIELMPRQAIYTLASREGAIEKKKSIVEKYNGETKAELLTLIREIFPLDVQDKRKKSGDAIISSLKRLAVLLRATKSSLTRGQKETIRDQIEQLGSIL
jgi:hypothetical protein